MPSHILPTLHLFWKCMYTSVISQLLLGKYLKTFSPYLAIETEFTVAFSADTENFWKGRGLLYIRGCIKTVSGYTGLHIFQRHLANRSTYLMLHYQKNFFPKVQVGRFHSHLCFSCLQISHVSFSVIENSSYYCS